MKGEEMLVVSLRGVNFQFRAPLGCTGQKAIIIHLTMNVFRVACKEIYTVISGRLPARHITRIG